MIHVGFIYTYGCVEDDVELLVVVGSFGEKQTVGAVVVGTVKIRWKHRIVG
jgi:hypothetical protein